jgi:hypothetical protein
MGNWRKLLAKMVNDDRPITYSYDDATRVLGNLGFQEAPNAGTSHRKWRLRRPGRPTITVGLVKANGPIRKEYILDMVQSLRENDLLPPE